MKRIMKMFLLIILIFPVFISAKTYESGISYANDYLIPFKDYKKYIVNYENIKFELENNILKTNSSFKNGGFISRTEYLLSQKNSSYSSTYLYDGSKYWTLTKNGTKYFFVTPDGLSDLDKNSSTGVRVTEYVKNSVIVSGKGSLINPYTFVPEYNVTVKTNDTEYGTLTEVRLVKHENGSNEVVEVATGLSSVTQTVFRGDNAILKVVPKSGYKFLADTHTCGETVRIENGNIFIISGITKDTTCQVNFGVGIFEIELDDNCSSNTNTDKNYLYLKYNDGWYSDSKATQVAGLVTRPSCKGHTFLGYYDSEGKLIVNSSGTIVSGNTKAFKENTKINAKWKINEYNLVIDPNGGKYNGVSSKTTIRNPYLTEYTLKEVTDNPRYTLTFRAHGSTNYTDGTIEAIKAFNRWEKVSGNGILNGNKYTYQDSDGEIKAIYNETSNSITTPNIERKYTIRYDLNGQGASFSKTQDVVYYTMNGWYDSQTGGNRVASNGASITTNQNKTLHAQWTSNSVTIGAALKTGYTCKWYKDGVAIENGTVFTPTEDVTLKLQCTANKYTISMQASCLVNAPISVTATYDSPMPTITLPSPKTGYKYTGYYVGSTKYYNTNGTSARNWDIASNSSAVLKADCTAKSYTINFNCNGGTGSTSSMSMTYDTAKNLSPNGCQKTSYEFTHWTTNANGTGSSYTNGQSVNNLTSTDGGTITLYAQWKLSNYDVYYNANGGSGSMSKSTFAYGSTYNLRSNTFTRAGFTFTGWNTKANGTGTSYSNAQSVKDIADISKGEITLYAQWRDSQSPTCTISVNSSNVALSPNDNVGVSSYGMGTSSTANYNGKSTYSFTAGTIYGYVRDAAGNTGTCTVSLASTLVQNKCPSGYSENSNGECYYTTTPDVKVCPSGYTECNDWPICQKSSTRNCKKVSSYDAIYLYDKTEKTCKAYKYNTTTQKCNVSYTKFNQRCDRDVDYYTKKVNTCEDYISSYTKKSKTCNCTASFGSASTSTVNSCTSSSISCTVANDGKSNVSCSANYELKGVLQSSEKVTSCTASGSCSYNGRIYYTCSGKNLITRKYTKYKYKCTSSVKNYTKTTKKCNVSCSWGSTSTTYPSTCSSNNVLLCNKNNSGKSDVSCSANTSYKFTTSTTYPSTCTASGSSFTCNSSNNGKSYTTCSPTYKYVLRNAVNAGEGLASCTENIFTCNSSTYGEVFRECMPKYYWTTSVGTSSTGNCTTSSFTCNSSNVGKSYISSCALDSTIWSSTTTTNKTSDCVVSNQTCNQTSADIGNKVTTCYHEQTNHQYYTCANSSATPTTDVATMTNWSCWFYKDYSSTACSSGTQSGNLCYHYTSKVFDKYVCPSGYTLINNSYCYRY